MSNYSDLTTRVKAAFLDGVLLVIMMFVFGSILNKFHIENLTVKKNGFVFIFLFYDPIFTSLFGGTIGHLMNGLRVRREDNEDKNINIVFALIRYVVKVILGMLSFFYISGNDKGRAIHDLAAGSVVIEKQKGIGETSSELLDN